jgi:hypothetical protein
VLKYQRSSYTSTVIVFFFPSERNDAALAQKLRDFDQNTMVPFRRASMERIQRELRNVKVQQLPDRTHMAIAVEHRLPARIDLAARSIRLVLAELAERLSAALKNDAELNAAVSRLLRSDAPEKLPD